MKQFNLNFWNIFTSFIALTFSVPIILVFLSLFFGFNDNFDHIVNVVLLEYSLNSLLLVVVSDDYYYHQSIRVVETYYSFPFTTIIFLSLYAMMI